MKATGIIRKVDELGRIVLPIELRRSLDIDVKDPIEIYTDGDRIVLKKYTQTCSFCGKSKDVVSFRDRLVCRKCIEEISSL
ncbi:MAG: AbrB/MazE/SpoVT family DNA-binding domain-containing protein [Oscillospiraceae bacterium]|nr:AbrB/MazE/SpoVT family DNA-binding domain-containing protein [Oscillospiraceae bacterium]